MNMATLNELEEDLKGFKNTLVIADFDIIARLVDVVEEDDDFYWVYDTMNGVIKQSCVFKWIPLKGILRQDDYLRMVHVWNLNKEQKAD